MKHDGLQSLNCPGCSKPLAAGSSEWQCTSCGRQFPIRDGVVCLCESNSFYDRYAEDECPFAPVPKGLKAAILKRLPFWSYREWRFWREVVPMGAVLLDIGCGRGKEVFETRASRTVGIDSSFVFLTDCREHYDSVILTSSPVLPFPDESFDVVVSSHVIGHIPAENKDGLIAEIARVLRQGGITAHIIETDSDSKTMQSIKKQPEVYKHYIVDQDGHVGLEHADSVVARFSHAGLQLEKMRLVDAIAPSVMYYEKYLAHPEFAQLPGLQWTRALRLLNAATRIGNLLYEVGFGTFHRTFEQWLGEPNRANFIHAAFRKRAAHESQAALRG